MSWIDLTPQLIDETAEEMKKVKPTARRKLFDERFNRQVARISDDELWELIDGLRKLWQRGRRIIPVEVAPLNCVEQSSTRKEKVYALRGSLCLRIAKVHNWSEILA